MNSAQPSQEELQKGYQLYLEKKKKQCEYQKRYAEKKKNMLTQLQEENSKLRVYQELFDMLSLQYPQIANQLANQWKSKGTTTAIKLPSQNPISSPSWPFVSMNDHKDTF